MAGMADVIPRRWQRYGRQRLRRPGLDQAFLELSDPMRTRLSGPLARRLIHGWANEMMSASEEYLQAIFRYVRGASGPILECGSGLSTLVLGIGARHSGQKVYALEDNLAWVEIVRSALARYGIENVEVLEVPLRDYGDYDWYDPPRDRLPHDFSLVICDGPQGSTPGGRYGLMPVLSDHLRSGCIVLLDDAERSGERQVLARWVDELHVSHEVFGRGKRFARLRMPPAATY